jgi:hypothetical protein
MTRNNVTCGVWLLRGQTWRLRFYLGPQYLIWTSDRAGEPQKPRDEERLAKQNKFFSLSVPLCLIFLSTFLRLRQRLL